MRGFGGIVVGVLLLLPVGLSAQQKTRAGTAPPEMDLAVTYAATRGALTSGDSFWLQGGSAELTAAVYRGLGVTADVTGTHAGDISPSGVGLTLVTATFGPSYTWTLARRRSSRRQWKAFGESLLGVANALDSVFPSEQGAQSSAESMALQIGGGVDVDLSRRWAVRVVQADWIRTQLPNATTNVQNNVQLAAGIVFRLSR